MLLCFFSDWDRKLRNAIYKFLLLQPKIPKTNLHANPELLKEPISYIMKAQVYL